MADLKYNQLILVKCNRCFTVVNHECLPILFKWMFISRALLKIWLFCRVSNPKKYLKILVKIMRWRGKHLSSTFTTRLLALEWTPKANNTCHNTARHDPPVTTLSSWRRVSRRFKEKVFFCRPQGSNQYSTSSDRDVTSSGICSDDDGLVSSDQSKYNFFSGQFLLGSWILLPALRK